MEGADFSLYTNMITRRYNKLWHKNPSERAKPNSMENKSTQYYVESNFFLMGEKPCDIKNLLFTTSLKNFNPGYSPSEARPRVMLWAQQQIHKQPLPLLRSVEYCAVP